MEAIYSSLWPDRPLYQFNFIKGGSRVAAPGYLIMHKGLDWGILPIGKELNGQKRILVQIIDASNQAFLNCYLGQDEIQMAQVAKLLNDLIAKISPEKRLSLQQDHALRKNSTKLSFFSLGMTRKKQISTAKKSRKRQNNANKVIEIDFRKKN